MKHRSHLGVPPVWLTIFAAVLFAVVPAARASDAGHSSGGDEKHHIAGLKAINLTPLAHGEPSPHFGGGLFAETAIIPHTLELELSVTGVYSHGLQVPIDLLLKVPFHLSDAAVAYVGAGLLLLVVPSDNDGAAYLGFASAFGGYYWLSDQFGLMAEVNFNGVWEHGFVPEAGAGLGAVMRF